MPGVASRLTMTPAIGAITSIGRATLSMIIESAISLSVIW